VTSRISATLYVYNSRKQVHVNKKDYVCDYYDIDADDYDDDDDIIINESKVY